MTPDQQKLIDVIRISVSLVVQEYLVEQNNSENRSRITVDALKALEVVAAMNDHLVDYDVVCDDTNNDDITDMVRLDIAVHIAGHESVVNIPIVKMPHTELDEKFERITEQFVENFLDTLADKPEDEVVDELLDEIANHIYENNPELAEKIIKGEI